jgi:hypothetical protein
MLTVPIRILMIFQIIEISIQIPFVLDPMHLEYPKIIIIYNLVNIIFLVHTTDIGIYIQ